MKRDWALLGVILALAGALAVFFFRTPLFPPLASQQAVSIDHAMRLLLAIAGIIFAAIVGVLGYSVLRFRRQEGDTTDGPPIRDNVGWVAAFLFVPLALVLGSATYGAITLWEVQQPPPGGNAELAVRVTAVQWGWSFEYPDLQVTSKDLVLPINKPVLFRLTTPDVIHSFWVPEFRVKLDALPGRETHLRITPTRLGEYQLLCAELCGAGHAIMRGGVRVVSEGEFQSWVRERQR